MFCKNQNLLPILLLFNLLGLMSLDQILNEFLHKNLFYNSVKNKCQIKVPARNSMYLILGQKKKSVLEIKSTKYYKVSERHKKE